MGKAVIFTLIKITIVFFFLDAANHTNNAKQSISDMCLGQWGSCASQQDCHMVTWSYNLNTQMISFNVTAAIDSDKWMGVGFNGQKEMVSC